MFLDLSVDNVCFGKNNVILNLLDLLKYPT